MKKKSTEKLASGYRINRAADDAAGLSISEKMRSQVRGLNRASKNIEDGISLIQVAEGALNETHSVLQRARELAVQAANDTNTPEDRQAIQAEIDEIVGEVDRIANQTNFNSEIYPLNYKSSNNTTMTSNTEIIDGKIRVDGNGVKWRLPDAFIDAEVYSKISSSNNVTIDGNTYHQGDVVKFGVIAQKRSNSSNYSYTAFGLYAPEANAESLNNSDNVRERSFGTSDITIDSLNTNMLKVDTDGKMFFSQNGTVYYMYQSDKGILNYGSTTKSPFHSDLIDSGFSYYRAEKVNDNDNNSEENNEDEDKGENGALNIQSGNLAWQAIQINLVDATADGIGLTDIDVSSFESAGSSISMIDSAIDKVSEYRSTFGAQQNRLEHARLVDDNTAENTDAAESRIRDTDMAEEMVNYNKLNILQQAGQSMIAQANQTQQGIMTILG